MDVQIEASWKKHLLPAFTELYFQQLVLHIKTEKQAGKTIYPAGKDIFAAFEHTPFDNVKVVILGQDPYHGPGQAHGLSFSVPTGVKPPPSLVNIFKELHKDVGMPIPTTGNLIPWAKQGVLLLNASLTVRANEPGSHAAIGWLSFTDYVIDVLVKERQGLVFLLWGKFAREKAPKIPSYRHLVLEAAHPSPFSADKGFFGCKHFSKANQWLVQQGQDPINWSLT